LFPSCFPEQIRGNQRGFAPQIRHFDFAKEGISMAMIKIQNNATTAKMKLERAPLRDSAEARTAEARKIMNDKKHPRTINCSAMPLPSPKPLIRGKKNRGTRAVHIFSKNKNNLHRSFPDVGIMCIVFNLTCNNQTGQHGLS
jgi:hypothetical protein